MELRKHPFMLYRGISIWPPAWRWTFGGSNFHPTGEIGMLENIRQSAVDPDKCFLMMSYGGSRYFGRLQFDQKGFCQQVCDLLKAHCGRPLTEVGELNIP